MIRPIALARRPATGSREGRRFRSGPFPSSAGDLIRGGVARPHGALGWSGRAALDERDRVGDEPENRRQAVGRAPGRAGQRDDERFRRTPDDLPREVGRREIRGTFRRASSRRGPGPRSRSTCAHALGRPVARRDAGAAGQDDQVRLARRPPAPARRAPPARARRGSSPARRSGARCPRPAGPPRRRARRGPRAPRRRHRRRP